MLRWQKPRGFGAWAIVLLGIVVTSIGAGALLCRRRREGARTYAAVLFLTVLWAFWEVGLAGDQDGSVPNE